MAHDLEIRNGEASFAYAGGPRPWHGLGLNVGNLMGSREAIVAGKLDWTVSKRPLVTQDTDALAIPDRFAIVRDDIKAVLGSVGADYTPVQNVEAFEPFDSVLGPESARIETVGALGKHGSRIFAMARLHDGDFDVLPGDPVERYFLMTTSHDGTSCVSLCFTSVRVVCQNTLSIALRGTRNEIRIKHTKGVREGLKLAPMILASANSYWSRLRETYQGMAQRSCDRARVRDILAKLFPEKVDENGAIIPTAHVLNLRMRVEALFDGGAVGADLAGHTDYGLLNAVSDYVERGRRVRSGSAWESSVFGSGSALRQRAFNLLVSAT